MSIYLDGALLAESVAPALLNDYLLEQCKLQGWRIVGYGWSKGLTLLDIVDAAGAPRTVEVRS